MGQITFQVVGDGSVGTKTKTFTVPDAHVNRLVAFAVSQFSPEGQTLNTTQALLAWANSMMDLTKTAVLKYEDKLLQPDPFDAV